MALIDKLKDTVTEAVKVARTAGHQVQSTAAPAVRQTVRLVRSQLDQRRATPPAPAARGRHTTCAPAPPAGPVETPAAPTPAVVAKNIAPKPEQARAAAKKKPAKKAAPGAKLPVKRTAAKPDPA